MSVACYYRILGAFLEHPWSVLGASLWAALTQLLRNSYGVLISLLHASNGARGILLCGHQNASRPSSLAGVTVARRDARASAARAG